MWMFCKSALALARREMKWWLIPLIIFCLLLLILAWLAQPSVGLSPFMYPKQ